MKTIFWITLIFTGMAAQQGDLPAQTTNVPDEVQKLFKTRGLDKNYDFSFHLQPPYLRADFRGDGKPETAILVKDKTSGKIGVAICNFSSNVISILGAGRDFGNGGDDFRWMDHWSVTPKAKLRQRIAALMKGDALFVEKTESAGALIYWNGSKYVWRQQGD